LENPAKKFRASISRLDLKSLSDFSFCGVETGDGILLDV